MVFSYKSQNKSTDQGTQRSQVKTGKIPNAAEPNPPESAQVEQCTDPDGCIQGTKIQV